jgi:serine protease inhibitor
MHPYRNLALAFVALSVIACRSATDVPQQQPELKALPRALSASEIQVSSSANRFSFSLFRQVNSDQADKNVFISPISASMALGMTMNGAAGTTFEQMRSASALGDADQDAINGGYKGLIGLLGGLDQTTTFSLANSIWYRQEFPFEQTFLDAGKTWFDADVRGLDFSSPSALPTINGWVNDKTSGKIPTILDRIDGDQVMFLINAIYFKGSWRDRFDPAKTHSAEFQTLAGGTQSMKLMYRPAGEGKLNVASNDVFSLVDLPYGNGAWAMSVLLPHQGKNVNDVIASLDEQTWAAAVGQTHETSMGLGLPKFSLSYERVLNDDLRALGMVDAFGNADFTRMSPRGRELYIQFVKQKTFVDVNEVGTEAAAATVVAMGVTSLPSEFIVNRPFVFVIRERLSGTILFMGKIVEMP